MDTIFAESWLTEIQSRYPQNLFSTEFIFSSDPEFTRLRNQPIAIGPTGPLTLLSVILRHGLDEQRRAHLFSSSFDLGSMKSIAKSQLSLNALAAKVRREKKLAQKLNKIDDVLRAWCVAHFDPVAGVLYDGWTLVPKNHVLQNSHIPAEELEPLLHFFARAKILQTLDIPDREKISRPRHAPFSLGSIHFDAFDPGQSYRLTRVYF